MVITVLGRLAFGGCSFAIHASVLLLGTQAALKIVANGQPVSSRLLEDMLEGSQGYLQMDGSSPGACEIANLIGSTVKTPTMRAITN